MMAEILILLTAAVLFTLVFIIAFLALFYVLTNFISGQTKKLSRDRNDLAVIISFGKVFVISLVGFSFLIYSMSFLLRIEGDIFKQNKSVKTIEIVTLPKKEQRIAQEENSEAPLFDLVIQAAAEQNAKKQLIFIFASGGIFSLAAIATMAGYIVYLARNERHHEI